MPALQSNCGFTDVSNNNVLNQWQNLGCRMMLLLISTTSNVAKNTLSGVNQKNSGDFTLQKRCTHC